MLSRTLFSHFHVFPGAARNFVKIPCWKETSCLRSQRLAEYFDADSESTRHVLHSILDMSFHPESISYGGGDNNPHQHTQLCFTVSIAGDWRISTDGTLYGAAAAHVIDGSLNINGILNRYTCYRKMHTNFEPEPNSETVDLIATCIGLQLTLDIWHSYPRDCQLATAIVHTTINTHSDYVKHVMTNMLPVWHNNGWIDINGVPIPLPRRSLIEATETLAYQVAALGPLRLVEVPRERNRLTVQDVDRVLLEMER